MFLHIVLFKLKRTDAPFLDAIREAFLKMEQECEGALSIKFVTNKADRSQGFGHAVVSTFTSEAAHEAYQIHPLHLAFKAFIMPNLHEVVVLDTDVTREHFVTA